MVAGHTNAIGGETYNQDLSERRADTIRRYRDREVRHQRHRSGQRRLRLEQAEGSHAPMDPANRRAQVVNMDTKTAAK